MSACTTTTTKRTTTRGRMSFSVFNGSLFLLMDIARAGPVEPGGHRWWFVFPLILTPACAWLVASLKRKGEGRQPCTAFIALQHALLVSGVVNSLELVQRSIGMVAGESVLHIILTHAFLTRSFFS